MTRDEYIDSYLEEMDLGPRWVLRQTRGAWAPGAAETDIVPAAAAMTEVTAVTEPAAVSAPASQAFSQSSPQPDVVRDPAPRQVNAPPVRPRAAVMPVAARTGGAGGAGGEAKTLPVGDLQGLDWDALEDAIRACSACGLCRQRRQAVPGVGDRQAEWLFIGEGPGQEEDLQGEPFVGPAGKLLDNMLQAIGLRRGDNVYIGNAVKCRPPNNRAPEASEINACRPYLDRQIALLQPKLIVLLGRAAAHSILGSEDALGSLRGRVHLYRDIPVVVTYHPAYLLRTLQDKAKAWEDLCLARQTMRRLQG